MTWEIRQGDALERRSNGTFLPGTHWRPRRPHWDREWLEERYSRRGLAAWEIAEEADCTENNILYWLAKHDIHRRTVSETRASKHWGPVGPDNPMYGRTGKRNPNYKDGSSPDRQRLYAGAEWKRVARSVRARDGYRCVRCGAEKQGLRSLHLHHLKPWAGHPELRFDPDNIVTLCKACHDDAHRKGGDARSVGRFDKATL